MAVKKHVGRNNGRSKHNNKYGNQNNNRNRATYKQFLDRYLNLAKEATSHGDQITAEGYYQHAEHYLRQLNEMGGAEHKKPSSPAQAPLQTTVPLEPSLQEPLPFLQNAPQEEETLSQTVEIDLDNTI